MDPRMKCPATTSASFCMSAFWVWASSTNLIICASAVSEPTLVAVNLSYRLVHCSAYNLGAIVFSTGMLSPVIIDSSMQ